MMKKTDPAKRTLQAGILAWILPGAGHYFLGQRGIAIVLFAAITFTYGGGLAIGGVKTCVNPYLNRWLFLAELGAGGYTAAGYILSNTAGGIDARKTEQIVRRTGEFGNLSTARQRELENFLLPYVSYYPESDVALIYLAVGGLLNVLAILDAVARAQTGGLPVFHHETSPESATAGESTK